MTKKSFSVIVIFNGFVWLMMTLGWMQFAQTTPSPTPSNLTAQDLTEKEQLKLENFKLKIQDSSKDALMIKQAYEQNQAKMHSLVDEEQGYLDQVCFDHKIPAAKCQISADGTKVQQRQEAHKPASPGPGAKK